MILDHRPLHVYVQIAYNLSLPRLGVETIAGARFCERELTSWFVRVLVSSGILAQKFEELFLSNFEVIGELFRGQVIRKDFSECVTLPFEQFEGEGVIFFERACPGLVRGPDRLVERHSFEDEGGELDGPVGRGGEAALGRGDEAGCGIQANRVSEEAGYAAGVFW